MNLYPVDAFLCYPPDRGVMRLDGTSDGDRDGAGFLVVATTGYKGSAGSPREDNMPPGQGYLPAEEIKLNALRGEPSVDKKDNYLAHPQGLDQSADPLARRVDLHTPCGT